MPNTITNRIADTATPAVEPILLAAAKLHCRVDTGADDNLITALIVAARQYCERITGRTFAARNMTASYNGFPWNGQDFIIPFSPVTAVSSVKYWSVDGVDTTMTIATDYRLDLSVVPARIRLPVTKSVWADTAYVDDAVRVSFTAGAATTPAAATQAMLLLIGHWYEHRESVTVEPSNRVHMTTVALLDSLRIGGVGL